MGNQTWVYCIQSDVMLAHRVEGQWPLMEWVQRERQRAVAEPDEEKQYYITEELLEYLLHHEPGMYGLTTFEKTWGLSNGIEMIMPHVPERFHRRFDHLFGEEGEAFPPEIDTPLRALDMPGWTFFTREEIIELAPLVRLALQDQDSDSLEYEWKDILTAHETQPYDWMVFIYPWT